MLCDSVQSQLSPSFRVLSVRALRVASAISFVAVTALLPATQLASQPQTVGLQFLETYQRGLPAATVPADLPALVADL